MAESIQWAEQLRRNMMADVSHELRTPLTVLQGNMRTLLDGVHPLELSEVGTLYDETRLLNRLVDDLRDLALVEAGPQNFTLRAIDLAAVLRITVESFGVAAETQHIIHVRLAELIHWTIAWQNDVQVRPLLALIAVLSRYNLL